MAERDAARDQLGRILITGATGYVGGRLLWALKDREEPVRCLVRDRDRLRPIPGFEPEVVEGDVLDRDSLDPAMAGVDTAYYLVHSMSSTGDFADADLRAAANFGEAAARAGVRRIVYLGGLGRGNELSKHLESRHEVGRVLRRSGVPVIEFRASIIIGSGSLSFEMIRALVRRLPVMITPSWVHTMAQPIGIEDVIAYLTAVLDRDGDTSQVFEIGGQDQVSYGQIMEEYATQQGLRRFMIPVPVLSPWLSSLWLGLVTPIYARVGKALISSLRNPTVVTDMTALETFPIRPAGIRMAIERALHNEDLTMARTRWSDALSSPGTTPRLLRWGGRHFGSRIVDSRVRRVTVTPDQAFTPIRRIGGSVGWYYADRLWRLRGFIDLLLGGVGVRRGRRDPDQVHVGDAVDFWRVKAVDAPRLLQLQAEMRLPGRAWLQFEVDPVEGGAVIRQTAIFDPWGLSGLCYWYLLYPLHALVFRGMLRRIAQAASLGEGVGDGTGEHATRRGRPTVFVT
jgi:uncharacterized protein YbjT (DUF2867 family)